MERQEVFYSGRVQGVGFRFATMRISSSFDVVGFVRNLGDGRVQIVAEGSPDTLDSFFAAVATKMDANIDRENRTIAAATGEYTSFEIRQ